MMQRGLFVLILFVSLFSTAYGAPVSFERAKVEARQYVYHDRHQAALGTLYCGCQWEWVGRSGGHVDAEADELLSQLTLGTFDNEGSKPTVPHSYLAAGGEQLPVTNPERHGMSLVDPRTGLIILMISLKTLSAI